MTAHPFNEKRKTDSLLFQQNDAVYLAQYPLWNGGTEFQKELDKHLKEAKTTPRKFHPILNPFNFTLSVYGQETMPKAEAISVYCDNLKLRHTTIDVEFGQCGMALDLMERHFEYVACNQISTDSFQDVLIINHFDLLVLHPDSEALMSLLLSLQERARHLQVVVIALFDRVIRYDNVTESTRFFRDNVMKQFDVRFYFAYPHAKFRQEYIRALLSEAGKTFDNLRIDLTDEQYAHLETYTAFASPQQICEFFAQKVFKDALSEQFVLDFSREGTSGPVTINYNVIHHYLTLKSGNLHILGWDPRQRENELSEICGKGGIPGAGRSAPTHAKKPAMTSFTAENSERKTAAIGLKKKKKKRKPNQMEDGDEEEINLEELI